MKIALIIGHSVEDQGARNDNSNVSEYLFNSYLAEIVSPLLENEGHEVNLVFRDEGYSKLPGKVNATGADISVSMHCNAFDDKSHGSEVLYYNGSVKGERLADFILTNVIQVLGTYNRGVKPCEYDHIGKAGDRGGYLLKYTSMPCVIVEPFFIDSDESLKIAQCKFHELAEAYAKGICEYFKYYGD